MKELAEILEKMIIILDAPKADEEDRHRYADQLLADTIMLLKKSSPKIESQLETLIETYKKIPKQYA